MASSSPSTVRRPRPVPGLALVVTILLVLLGLPAVGPGLELTPAAEAGVRVEQGPDGRLRIVSDGRIDEPAEARERRRAARLLDGPSDLAEAIDDHARHHGLDPRLVRAVIQVESGWDERARSVKGAMGLMQLMPATARELAVRDPWDPLDNLRGGILYLRRMLDRFGRHDLALAAYNAGPGAVERHGGIPPYAETRAYVTRVLALWNGTAPDFAAGVERRAATPRWRSTGERPLLTNH